MSTRCQRALSKVTDVSNLLGRTRTMWSSYNIMISCIYVNIVYMLMLQTADTRTRTDVSVSSVGAVHDTKYLSVKHFSLHFCCGGICHKLSFRQQEFTL